MKKKTKKRVNAYHPQKEKFQIASLEGEYIKFSDGKIYHESLIDWNDFPK